MNAKPVWSRREFLHFFGSGVCAGSILSLPLGSRADTPAGGIPSISPTDRDALVLADGLQYRILISWGDDINKSGDKFGYNNDYIAWLPVDNNPDDCLFWINHESITLGYFLTPDDPAQKSPADVERERREVGGSILRIKKINNEWRFVADDRFNRRIDATTEIPIISEQSILGKTSAIGTLGNCAGGITPWKTFLSCEENYHYEVGEVDLSNGGRSIAAQSVTGWDRYHDLPPEHYGWVVEIDPFTGAAKKHTSMGRFAHESATVVPAVDGRCVVYSGDDVAGGCLYKFIADVPGRLDKGTLYVADVINGVWRPLDIRQDARLGEVFGNQTELLIRTREAARIAGGTELDRPEDIERDPVSGAVYMTLTKHRDRPFGSIFRVVERNNNPLSLSFTGSSFLTGGDRTGFACPDNLAFDSRGNLWFTSDISSEELNEAPYSSFRNNGLFFVPMSGSERGQVYQVASAPVHAELTGICFSMDSRELFLSVQHPGEISPDRNNLSSHWPEGGDALPKPSVVVISGDFLNTFSTMEA